jgi:Flp pilus assembly protein TadG
MSRIFSLMNIPKRRQGHARIYPLLKCRKGSVALWVAVMLPGMVIALALALETSNWYGVQSGVQRTADAAALAGALNFQATNNAQTAATAAARMAELNGYAGTATPSWNSGTSTLTDNKITVQKIAGIKNSNGTAFKVTVGQSVPLVVAGMFSSQGAVPISASATAEIVTKTTGTSGGGQPCIVALSSSGTVEITGTINMTLQNCTIESNGIVQIQQTGSGAGILSTPGVYSAGAIEIVGNIQLAHAYPSSGTIPDPYASNQAVQNAIANAANLSGVSNHSCTLSGCSPALPNGSTCTPSGQTLTCTLNAGNYGNIAFNDVSFNLNFTSGLYLFQNGISFTAGSTCTSAHPCSGIMSGSGVTVVFNGQLNLGTLQTANIALYARSVAGTGSSIPAIAITGNASQLLFSQKGQFIAGGVVYLPKALVYLTTATSVGVSVATCAEMIASSIILPGNGIFSSGPCAQMGATTFTSVAPTTTSSANIVQ